MADFTKITTKDLDDIVFMMLGFSKQYIFTRLSFCKDYRSNRDKAITSDHLISRKLV